MTAKPDSDAWLANGAQEMERKMKRAKAGDMGQGSAEADADLARHFKVVPLGLIQQLSCAKSPSRHDRFSQSSFTSSLELLVSLESCIQIAKSSRPNSLLQFDQNRLPASAQRAGML